MNDMNEMINEMIFEFEQRVEQSQHFVDCSPISFSETPFERMVCIVCESEKERLYSLKNTLDKLRKLRSETI